MGSHLYYKTTPCAEERSKLQWWFVGNKRRSYWPKGSGLLAMPESATGDAVGVVWAVDFERKAATWYGDKPKAATNTRHMAICDGWCHISSPSHVERLIIIINYNLSIYMAGWCLLD